MDLSWTLVAGAASYNVYRNGALLGSTTGPSFTDAAFVSAGDAVTYFVTSVGSGGESPPSSPIGFVFLSDEAGFLLKLIQMPGNDVLDSIVPFCDVVHIHINEQYPFISWAIHDECMPV